MNSIGWHTIAFTTIFVLMVAGLVTLLFSRSSYAKIKAVPFAFANGFGVMVWLAALVYTRYVEDIFLAHRLAFSAAYILVVGMFGLALTFPNSPLNKFFKRVLAVDMTIGAICIGMILFTDKILTARNFLGAHTTPFSPLGRVYLLLLAAHLVAAIAIFIRRYLKEVRNRLYFNYIVLAFILFFLIAVTTNLILPLTGVVAFSLVGPLSALLPFITVVYALGITNLNDIGYIIAQLLRLGIRLVVLVGLFIAGALLHRLLGAGYYSSGWVIAMSLVAGVGVICFYLIGTRLDRYIENRVAYAWLSPDEVREKLILGLSGAIELDRNATFVMKFMKQTIGVHAVGIDLQTKDGAYWSAGELTIPPAELRSLLTSLMQMQTRHASRHAFINVASLPEGARGSLQAAHVYAVQHLRTESGIEGLYLLGEKFSQEVFTRQDAELMHAITETSDLSIERALFYSQIQAFNATLQQRVDDATHELRKANSRLKTLDLMKDDFLSMASHQLRSPATAVRDAIQLLEQAQLTPAERKRILELADASSERLVNVVTDMLSVARIQAGHFNIEKSLVDMVELVGRTVKQVSALAQSQGATIVVNYPDRPVKIKADRAKVIEMLSNYLENAIRYSVEHGEITVTLKQDEPHRVSFEVRDRGIGVPARERKQLFGRFFRASNARKNQPNGNGIGLFVVKTIARAHGGDAYYEPQNDGSLFGFWLKS